MFSIFFLFIFFFVSYYRLDFGEVSQTWHCSNVFAQCAGCTVAANLISSSNLMQSCWMNWMKASSANYSKSIHLVFHWIFRLIFSFSLPPHLLFLKHIRKLHFWIRFASPFRSHKIFEKFRCKTIHNVDLFLCCLNGSILLVRWNIKLLHISCIMPTNFP